MPQYKIIGQVHYYDEVSDINAANLNVAAQATVFETRWMYDF